MAEALTTTDLQGALPLLARGKVRDLYEIDEKTLLFVATDRISAYDVIMENVGIVSRQLIRGTTANTTFHVGYPEQRQASHTMHKNMVQDTSRCHTFPAHTFYHSRSPASDPRITTCRSSEPKHASPEIQDLPH